MPDRIVIVNSTPIISLREIGLLDVLEKLYKTITIPEAVRKEVTVRNPKSLVGYDWIHVQQITNKTAKETFSSALHDGEVEVMLLAKEIGANLVIIDDGLARKHAKYLGLKITGTIGVLLRAKQDGIIKDLRPYLNEMIRYGFYVSENVYQEVVRLAGEVTL